MSVRGFEPGGGIGGQGAAATAAAPSGLTEEAEAPDEGEGSGIDPF